MNTHLGRATAAFAAAALALSLAGCGGGDDGSGSGASVTVGLLLPETGTARYEKFDKPLFEKAVARFTFNKGEVLYANAEQDAATQSSQVEAMIDKEVDVLVVDAVDSKAIAGAVRKAKQAGIPVVAYDRLAEGPIDAYVSYDNRDVGMVQGEALLKAMGGKAGSGRIVMMNGSPADPNAKLFKAGAHSVLDGKTEIGKEYDTVDWKPENAAENMRAALAALGPDRIAGVYSANDGLAGGIISALKRAGVTKLPPVTGQDAELAAVQRIVAGDQYMTVYKRYAPEAAAAAEIAVGLARGERVSQIINQTVDSPTDRRIPAVLIPGISVTRSNVKETVVLDGVYSVAEICTAQYRADCAAIGLTD
ncbi:substrate-binding domain-containing protein [Streptomyces bambusae]|uniref:sugar ABC transporter substrate-binding protein n=1 Tax=Streptomyces bambusae TaxID=1550616 RepID=UPI001CFF180A|nr:substrate-binding domain-containing protein [Streptomyces bambusae]MCB5165846.1 substrate-binding domain-containing protein [Streptomyces bambusae]